jgi:putative FmdB family regulatory protein
MSPIYDLTCLECGHMFEQIEKNPEEAKQVGCPRCRSGELQLGFTSFGHYKIEGNNSASVTPKKYRGGS